MLPPETKAEIKRLFFAEHLTMNMIASKLGVHHDTVKAALEVERFHPRSVFRSSQLDPYVSFIIQMLEEYPKRLDLQDSSRCFKIEGTEALCSN